MTNGKRSVIYGSNVWFVYDLGHDILCLWDKGQDSDSPVLEPSRAYNISAMFVLSEKI